MSFEQMRLSFPAWKVYVFGLDVTDDVSSCVANWNDGRAPNTAQIILQSELDKYIMTPADIHALYDDIPIEAVNIYDVYSSGDKGATVFDQIGLQVDTLIQQRIGALPNLTKRAVLTVKTRPDTRIHQQRQSGPADGIEKSGSDSVGQAEKDLASGKTSLVDFAALKGDFLRFPFQVGQPIFHTGDPVRIFLRDPLHSTDWYFAASGQVTDWIETVEPTGLRTLTLTIQDPLRLFNLARVSTNPGLADLDVLADPLNDSFFRTFFGDLGISELTLPEILFFLTFGVNALLPEAQKRSNLSDEKNAKGANIFDTQYYGVNAESATKSSAPIVGVGAFNYDDSEVVVFGPPSKEDERASQAFVGPVDPNVLRDKVLHSIFSLEDWQTKIDHKVPSTVTDVVKMAIPGQRFNAGLRLFSMVDDLGLLDPLDVIKEIGEHPEIYPPTFGRLMLLMPNSLGPGTNRSILLKDLIQGIVTTTEWTSRLAMILNVVQRVDFSFYATPKGDIICEMPLYSFRPENFGEKFRKRYIFSMEDTIRWSSHFEDERVKTQVRSPNWIVEDFKSLGSSSDLMFAPGTVTLRALVPMFGMRMETVDPHGYITNERAAAYYGFIKLTQLNADAWRQNIETVIRLGLGPNRPCLFEAREFIATIRGGTDSIVWGKNGSVQQKLSVNYRRGWSGQLTPSGFRAYESFGGRAAQGIDYAMLFQDSLNATPSTTKSYDWRTFAGANVSNKVNPVLFQRSTAWNAEVSTRLLTAIKDQESGGNYATVNTIGALGAYQVMPKNIADWTTQAGVPGAPLTSAQFLANPAAQDQVAAYKLQQYYNIGTGKGLSEGDSVRYAASSWYSGDGNKFTDTRPQRGGPSIAAYSNHILLRYQGAYK